MLKKIISVIMALFLTISFTACAKNGPAENEVMSLDGHSITDAQYSFWLSSYKTTFLYYFSNSSDTDDFWDSLTDDGESYEEYVSGYISDYVQDVLVSTVLFDKYKLKLDDDAVKAIDDDIAEKIDYCGELEISERLAGLGMDLDDLRASYIAEAEYEKVTDYLYGENGTETPTDAELEDYYQNNYSDIKYIIIYTGTEADTDAEGNFIYSDDGKISTHSLNDEEKAEKQAMLDELKTELDAGADFDELIDMYSEVDLSSYPHGFVVSDNDYSDYGYDIVSTAKSMSTGDIKYLSDDDATYIIRKYDLPTLDELSENDDIYGDTLTQMLTYCTRSMQKEFFAEYKKDIRVNDELLASFNIRRVKQNSYF